MVSGLERAGGRALDDLLRIYRQETLGEEDVQRVLAILDEVGAKDSAQQLTESAAAQALDALRPVALPGWARDEAEELVDFLSRRDY